MQEYKITVLKDFSSGEAKFKKGMNVEVFCDSPRTFGTGKLLSEAFEKKYDISNPWMDNLAISGICQDKYDCFELEEL